MEKQKQLLAAAATAPAAAAAASTQATFSLLRQLSICPSMYSSYPESQRGGHPDSPVSGPLNRALFSPSYLASPSSFEPESLHSHLRRTALKRNLLHGSTHPTIPPSVPSLTVGSLNGGEGEGGGKKARAVTAAAAAAVPASPSVLLPPAARPLALRGRVRSLADRRTKAG